MIIPSGKRKVLCLSKAWFDSRVTSLVVNFVSIISIPIRYFPKWFSQNPVYIISRQHSAQIVRRKSHATFPLIVGRWSIFWKVKSNKYGGHLSTTQHSLGTPKSLCHAPCTILNMTANTLLSKSFHLHFQRLITFHLTFKPKRNILKTF